MGQRPAATARQLLGRIAMEELMAVAKERDPDMPKVWALRVLRRLEPAGRRVVTMREPSADVLAEMRTLFLGDVSQYLDAA